MTLNLPVWAALPAALLLVAGGLATLTGAFGLLRLRDFYSRMHSPTMCTTLGTGCVLIASMLVSSALLERPVVHEVLLALFLVITTPITAILLMRAAIYRSGGLTAAREPTESLPADAQASEIVGSGRAPGHK
jgi:multicomponent K+:H+ antiporter subunit G